MPTKADLRFYTIVDLNKYKTKLSNNQILPSQIAGGNSDDPLIDITDSYYVGDVTNYTDTQHPTYHNSINLTQYQSDYRSYKGYRYLNKVDGKVVRTSNNSQVVVKNDGLTLTGRSVNFVGSNGNDDYVWAAQNPQNQSTIPYTNTQQKLILNYNVYPPFQLIPHNDNNPNTYAHYSTNRFSNSYLSGAAYQNNIDAGGVSITGQRNNIRTNCETGFRLNYNTQSKGTDIGYWITPPHNYTQNVKGNRQIWYRTGAFYGHFRGSQGGGGGAGGARTRGGQCERSGGSGAAAATTKHAGFIYPLQDISYPHFNYGIPPTRITSIQSQMASGGSGGLGGSNGGAGQWGQNGGDSGSSTLIFDSENNGVQEQITYLRLTINGTRGGAGGMGSTKCHEVNDKQDRTDHVSHPGAATSWGGYGWIPCSKDYPAPPAGPGNKNDNNYYGGGGWSGAPGINATFRSYTLLGSRTLHTAETRNNDLEILVDGEWRSWNYKAYFP